MARFDDRRSEHGGTQQIVQVENGSGYGVIGADLHVFQDRGPIYLLTEHRPTAEPGNDWLTAQPSRMLNARWQVVEFAGRERELAGLTAWRDREDSRLAVRWLHAPGGQGKTRLAAKLAADSHSSGWKVVNILHGSAGAPPGSHDMRHGDCRGLLLIADYADRWPVSHLRWLLSNSIFHQALPTRLLLLSRTPQHGQLSARFSMICMPTQTSNFSGRFRVTQVKRSASGCSALPVTVLRVATRFRMRS